MTASIPLTHGFVAIVDRCDYEQLAATSWYAYHQDGKVYARSSANGDYMHRVLLGAPKGTRVQHKDRNPLHNWRGNLRVVPKSAAYPGVCKDPQHGYRAQIVRGGKNIWLGTYDTPEGASQVYERFSVMQIAEEIKSCLRETRGQMALAT